MSVFGPYVTGNDVTDAVRAHLETWLPTYLAEMCRHSGRTVGDLPMPGSWTTAPVFHQYLDEELPAALVVCPGTDEIIRTGDGSYAATFPVTVGVLVKGQDAENANEVAKLYAAAIMMSTVQQGSLNSFDEGGDLSGFADGTDFVGFADDAVPADYMAVGWYTGVELRVRVSGVVTAFGGPSTPDLDPQDLPVVQTAEIAVERITT